MTAGRSPPSSPPPRAPLIAPEPFCHCCGNLWHNQPEVLALLALTADELAEMCYRQVRPMTPHEAAVRVATEALRDAGLHLSDLGPLWGFARVPA